MSEKLFNVGIKSVIRRGDKVLIVKNTKGFWEVPGGRMDADESIPETLKRELLEELPNIEKIQIGSILDAGRLQKDIKDNVSLVLIFFAVTADFKDSQPTLSHEHVSFRWATKEEALPLVYDTCKTAISRAFATDNSL